MNLIVERGQTEFEVAISAKRPSPIMWVLNFGALAPAWAFWMVGVGIVSFRPKERSGDIFIVTAQLWACFLASSVFILSTYEWVFHLSSALVWYISLLFFHFHTHFPVKQEGKLTNSLIIVGYIGAFFGSIASLLQARFTLFNEPVAGAISVIQATWFIGYSVLALVLVFYAYMKADSQQQSRQIGLIMVGGVSAILPLLVFTLLPDIVFGRPVIPYDFAYYLLALIPLTYGYAFLRYKFLRIEKYVNRSMVLLLVLTIVVGIYLAANWLLRLTFPGPIEPLSIINLLLFALALLSFPTLRRRIQVIFDRLFYGGWYDYTSVVTEVSQTLSTPSGSLDWAQMLTESIQSAMRVEWVVLFLPEENTLRMRGFSGDVHNLTTLQNIRLPKECRLLRLLSAEKQAVDPESWKIVSEKSLSQAEAFVLKELASELIIPIFGREESLGFLLFSGKLGGDKFSVEDRRILDVVTKQASIAFQNAQLVNFLEEKIAENQQYKREIVPHKRRGTQTYIPRLTRPSYSRTYWHQI